MLLREKPNEFREKRGSLTTDCIVQHFLFNMSQVIVSRWSWLKLFLCSFLPVFSVITLAIYLSGSGLHRNYVGAELEVDRGLLAGS